MRKWKKVLCVVLCIPVMSGLIRTTGTPDKVQASDLTNDLIKEKEAEIDSAKELKKQLQSNLTDVKRSKRNWKPQRESDTVRD